MARKSLIVLLLLTSLAFAAGPETKNGNFKTSDGVRLHYLEVGHGPAIVFIPGWSMPAWIWERQISYFAERYHVIALDPRSQGESDKVSEGDYPERRAQDVKELLDHLDPGPAVLVGWSLAVSELVTYAERFGGSNVRAYVLVDGFLWDKPDPQVLSAILGFCHQIEMSRREVTEKFGRSMYRKPQSDDYIHRVVTASLQMPSDSAVAALATSIARSDWRTAINKLDRPVLLTHQTETKSTADLIKSILPSARVEQFDDAGHALFVDDADRFNSVLEDFIAHLPSP
jgi:microsomal epoxide hydrolase